MDKPRAGHWLVDGKPHVSKVQAVYAATKQNTHDIRFYFHDHVYSQMDWSLEIPDTLDQLYEARARQLRANNDYLVLFFSAGSDSTNILTTFFKHGIKLDEIACFHATGPHNNPYNHEIEFAGQPYLERAKQLGIKITALSEAQLASQPRIKTLEAEQWALNNDATLSPLDLMRFLVYDNHADWLRLRDKGQRLSVIIGQEKPRLVYEAGKWRSAFLDVTMGFNNPIIHAGKEKITLEPFYTTPDMPLLTIKQSQVMKQYLEANYTADESRTNFSKETFKSSLYQKLARCVLYPDWNDATYSVGKFSGIGPKEKWIAYSNTEIGNNYLGSLKWIEQNVDAYFLNSQNGGDMKGCFSRWYDL